ncbi:hypothetical protein GCM10010361_11540 [Streptomyces olivaceiscleroticus]|uniref:Uncharacterized protein n=1 Tax=Streptomyces olivaceiscleroticus TaxID=68245 RepID=A0ABP3JF99_9ACTN
MVAEPTADGRSVILNVGLGPAAAATTSSFRGQGLASVQHQVRVAVEVDPVLAGQQQRATVTDLCDPAVGPVGVHGGGILALQAEYDRLGRAVPVTGGAERPEELDP